MTTPYPYSIECETLTPTTRSYLREWFPSPEAAAQAKAQHQREGWQRVDDVAPGAIPGASVTGKQILASGGINLPRREGR